MSHKSVQFAIVFAAHLAVLTTVGFVLPSRVLEMRSNDYKSRSEPIARNLLEGKGLREANGNLCTRYPPGHPLYLYTAFWIAKQTGLPEQGVLIAISLGLKALSGALLFLLLVEFWSVRLSAFMSFAWLLYLPSIYSTILSGNDVIYTPLFVFNIWVFWRGVKNDNGWLFFLAGVLLGLGMLIWPFVIGLPLFVVTLCMTPLLSMGRKRRVAVSCLIVAGVVLTILPWQVWTYQQTRRFYLISSVGVHGVLDGLTYGVPHPDRLDLKLRPGELRLMTTAYDAWQSGEIASFGELTRWGREEAASQPLDFMTIICRKVLRAWYATDSHRYETQLLIMQAPYLIICVCGPWMCLRRDGDVRRIAMICLVVIAFYWAMAVAGLSILRYMVPVMPLLLLLSTPVVESFVERFANEEQSLPQNDAD